MTCFGHKPETHLSYDAEIALAEDSVNSWTVCVLKRLPSGIIGAVLSGEGSHSRSEEAPVWEHDLHTTVIGKVITIRSVSKMFSYPGTSEHGSGHTQPLYQ